jgi:hypothetical protein
MDISLQLYDTSLGAMERSHFYAKQAAGRHKHFYDLFFVALRHSAERHSAERAYLVRSA